MLRRHGRDEQPEPEEDYPVRARVRVYDNEFDSFLAGAYIDWLLRNNQPIPAWAWVNRVAHAGIDDLEELASGVDYSPCSREGLEPWRIVTTFIASEVVAAAGDETTLAYLQQRVLVPLELHLAESWWAAVTPREVAATVLVALQNAAR
jgi:hypothetical protein